MDLHVPKGSIYGFLGANGAGKSTTIRHLLGLLRPQDGSITLFGKHLKRERKSILQKVGSLIESPSFYGHLTASENLKIACDYRRIHYRRIGVVLEMVGLAQHDKKTTQKFSMGMKQRLGLATALLHDPDLLILDEPTNGLDPAGILEIRQLLVQLKEQGKTILLSSHLLAELEKTVTRLGILQAGRMVFEGTLSELEARRSQSFRVELQTPHRALTASIASQVIVEDGWEEDLVTLELPDRTALPELLRNLTAAGVDLYAVRPVTNDLEYLFLQLTNEPNV